MFQHIASKEHQAMRKLHQPCEAKLINNCHISWQYSDKSTKERFMCMGPINQYQVLSSRVYAQLYQLLAQAQLGVTNQLLFNL